MAKQLQISALDGGPYCFSRDKTNAWQTVGRYNGTQQGTVPEKGMLRVYYIGILVL
jgi:hypothetical protein